MFTFEVTNTYTRVTSDSNDLQHKYCIEEIYKTLSIFVKGALFSEKYNTPKRDGTRVWDGYVRFFNPKTGIFLTGLLPFVIKVVTKANLYYHIENSCVKPPSDNYKAVYKLRGHPELRDYQIKGVDIALSVPRGVYSLATNSGKGLIPDTPILTKHGWVEIGKLSCGDKVIAVDGTETTVTGMFRRGPQPTFKISFNDHTSIVCDSDHLWAVKSSSDLCRGHGWRIEPTSKLINRKKSFCKRHWQLYIPNCEPVQFEKSQLPIDPYVFGVGLSKHLSVDKFIPKEYLFSSVENRLDILRGLLNTDGNIAKDGRSITFSSSSEQLISDIIFLVRSLGGRAVFCKPKKAPKYTYHGEVQVGQPVFRVDIFRLVKNKERVRKFKRTNLRRIISIESNGIQDTVCISVDHPSGLFVAKDFIVTHNTSMAVAISESIPVNTIFLVDRRELFNQAKAAFEKHGTRKVGVIQSGVFRPADVTIAMTKTLYSLVSNEGTEGPVHDYLSTVQMFFCDEVHKATAKTWKKILLRMPNAYHRYGLSGTPITPDSERNMALLGLFGPLILKVSNIDLVERDISANPRVHMIKYYPEKAPTIMDYDSLYSSEIVRNEKRNSAIAHLIAHHVKQGRSVLTIVEAIEHGKLLQSYMKTDYGMDVPFACGELLNGVERDAIYQDFKSREIPAVIASMIYKEGVDIPSIDVLIFAAGEKSLVTVLQVLGRGLRKREDKTELQYYDFMDSQHRILVKHTKMRAAIYKKEGFDLIEYDTKENHGSGGTIPREYD